MSISDNYVPVKTLGNGSTTVFTGNWKILSSAYIQVFLEDVTTGVQTLQSLGSDYTLTFDDDGFEVTFLTAPTSDYYVVIGRDVDLTQTDPYRTSKGFQGKVIEDSFDKLTAISQDQQNDIDRSPKFPLGASITDASLPNPLDGYGVVWDGTTGKLRNTESSLAILEGNAATVADDIDNVNIVATNISSVNTAATNIAAIIAAPTEAANAAASAAAALVSENNAADSESNASTSETNAAASAAAAAASAAEGLYNNVITITDADSPYVPTEAQEGYLFRCDTTSGNVVINLSALSVYGEDMKFGFVKVDASGNSITINRGGTDTINGGTSINLATQYETHVLVGDEDTGTWLDTVQTTGIADNSVTNAKLADVATATIKGRTTSGTGNPEDLTPAQARGVMDVYSTTETDAAIAAAASPVIAWGTVLSASGGTAAVTMPDGSNLNVTRVGVGEYDFTFDTNPANANYSVVAMVQYDTVTDNQTVNLIGMRRGVATTTSGFSLQLVGVQGSGTGGIDLGAGGKVFVQVMGTRA